MSNPVPCLALFLAAAAAALAVETNPVPARPTADYVPDVAALVAPASSELRELVERFVTDRKELVRFYSVKGSALQTRRLREFYQTWQERLAKVDFEKLGVDGRIDATLLRTRLKHELQLLNREAQRATEMAPLLPFAEDIARLQETRRMMEPVDAADAAKTLDRIRQGVERTRAGVEAGMKSEKENLLTTHPRPFSPERKPRLSPPQRSSAIVRPTGSPIYRRRSRTGSSSTTPMIRPSVGGRASRTSRRRKRSTTTKSSFAKKSPASIRRRETSRSSAIRSAATD